MMLESNKIFFGCVWGRESFRYPKVFSYGDILDFTETIRNDSKFFRVFDGYDEFYTNKIMCGEESCSFPVIEMTNFSNGPDFVRRLPVVLLVSGYSGEDFLSINMLVAFIHLLRHRGSNIVNTGLLLNNYRFVIVLMANPNGVYNLSPFEHNSIHNKKINPLADFPLYKEQLDSCFESTSAQIMNSLFMNRLIVGTLVFQQGDPLIAFPWSNKKSSEIVTSDTKLMSIASVQLADFLNSQQNDYAIKFHQGRIIDFDDKISANEGRCFEDWAFSASWNLKSMNLKCIPNKMEVRKGYPDESNRSMVFLVQTGKEDFESTKNWILDLKVELFSKLIEKFVVFISPKFELDQITYNPSEDQAECVIKFKGCLNITGPVILNNIRHTSFSAVTIKQNFENIVTFNIQNIYKDKVSSLKFNFYCSDEWKNSNLDNLPETHMLKMRFDPNYHISYKESMYVNPRNLEYSIFNINTKVRDGLLADIHNQGTYSEVLYEEGLYSYFYMFTIKITKHRYEDVLQIEPILKLSNIDVSKENVDYIAVKEYGEIGCCGDASLGENLYITTNFRIEIRSLEQYYGLIGRVLEVKLNNTEKPYYATIEYLREESEGYSMPPNGLSCSSFKYSIVNNYYYVSLHEKDNRLFISIFTSNSRLYQINFLGYSFTPYIISSFETEKFKQVYEYELIISNFKDFNRNHKETLNGFDFITLSSRLKGKRFYFMDSEGSKMFSCSLGIKNAYYSEIDNLRYNIKSYDVNSTIKNNGLFLYLMSFSLVTILGVVIGAIICYAIFKKRKTEVKAMFTKIGERV